MGLRAVGALAVVLLVAAQALADPPPVVVEASYTGALGAGHGTYVTGLVLCEQTCPLDQNGNHVPAIGGASLPGPGKHQYTKVVVEVDDDLWHGNAAASICVTRAGSSTCEGWSEASCGTVADIGDQQVDRVVVQVYTLYVSAEMHVCGGTTGTVRGLYFK